MATTTRDNSVSEAPAKLQRAVRPCRESTPHPFCFNVDQYSRMFELGWFGDKRVELLNGEVFSKYDARSWRWNVKHYEKMAALGWFSGRKVQLVGGKVYEMSPMNNPHWWGIARTMECLRQVFGKGYLVVSQLPLTLGEHAQPEPDVAVLAVDVKNHPVEKPTSALLVVEISDTTLRFDQTKKSLDYAQAGIIEYWILNLKARQLEVRRNPNAKGYSETTTLKADDKVSPLSSPDAKIKVADLLP